MKNGVLWNSISKQINDWLKLRRESRIRFSYFHRKMHTIGMVAKAYCHWLGYASTAFSSTLVKQYRTRFQAGSQSRLCFFGFSKAVRRLLLFEPECANAVLTRTRTKYPTILWKINEKAMRKFSLWFFDCCIENAFFFQHQTAFHPFCYPWSHSHCIPCAILSYFRTENYFCWVKVI